MKIDRYKILRQIGHGGSGIVFLGQDHLERLVAVKVLSRELSRAPEFRARFEREAKIVARLEHSFVVPIYDYGEDEGQLYIVMRYMSGGTLTQWANGRLQPLVKVVPIVERLASALDAAHQCGIVHRDLNPGNVLFDGYGQAFLADFGIAKRIGDSPIPHAGIVGTPEYMSPEQAAGRDDVNGRADVYALGVMVYQLLSGKLPFSADTPMSVLQQHLQRPLEPLNTARLGLPVVRKKPCVAIYARRTDRHIWLLVFQVRENRQI